MGLVDKIQAIKDEKSEKWRQEMAAAAKATSNRKAREEVLHKDISALLAELQAPFHVTSGKGYHGVYYTISYKEIKLITIQHEWKHSKVRYSDDSDEENVTSLALVGVPVSDNGRPGFANTNERFSSCYASGSAGEIWEEHCMEEFSDKLANFLANRI